MKWRHRHNSSPCCPEQSEKKVSIQGRYNKVYTERKRINHLGKIREIYRQEKVKAEGWII